jgi:hypothetical protein
MTAEKAFAATSRDKHNGAKPFIPGRSLKLLCFFENLISYAPIGRILVSN